MEVQWLHQAGELSSAQWSWIRVLAKSEDRRFRPRLIWEDFNHTERRPRRSPGIIIPKTVRPCSITPATRAASFTICCSILSRLRDFHSSWLQKLRSAWNAIRSSYFPMLDLLLKLKSKWKENICNMQVKYFAFRVYTAVSIPNGPANFAKMPRK
jgi:hypothetical protein